IWAATLRRPAEYRHYMPSLPAGRRRWPRRRPRPGIPAPLLDLLDLAVFQLHRRRPAEARDRHLEPGALLVDLLDEAVERRERAVGDAYLLADLEGDRRLGAVDALLDLAQDPLGLGLADRHRLAAGAEEARDLGGVLDQMPG